LSSAFNSNICVPNMSVCQMAQRGVFAQPSEYTFSELGSEFQELKWSHRILDGIGG
jgi:hypothetical protein